MKNRIRFGTDGWRAIIAEDYTFENVRICAQSVAEYLKDVGLAGRGLVVGYDTRFASEEFASAVAEVVAANGITVYLADKAAPTPVISYSILTKHAGGAVIITASHNPAAYNGFKYKPDYAGSASPEVVAALEQRIDAIQDTATAVPRVSRKEALAKGILQLFDPTQAYLQHIAELVDLDALRNAGIKVAVDSMYGTGAGYFKHLLGGGKTEIIEIDAERNPLFPGISPEPITRNLAQLSETIRATGASVGLATDGDADRLGVMDEEGQFVTQLQTFALLCLYLLEIRGERGPIVKSLTTTSMAQRLGELYNVSVFETPVGFKYIGPKMMSENALIGGEESGGYGFRGHIPERDGILAGLYLIDLMVHTRKTPKQLVEYLYSRVGPHYYDRIDLHFPAEQRNAIIDRIGSSRPSQLDGLRVTNVLTEDGFRFILENGSWLLIRFSGTEPVLRIYTETDSPERVQRLLTRGKELTGLA